MRLSTKFKLPILHKYTWMLFINLFLVMYNIGLYNMIKARLKVEEPRGLRAFAENQLKKELMKAKMEKMLEDLQYDQDVGNDVEAAAVQVESLQDDPEFPGEEEGDSIDDKVLDGPDPLESGAEEEVEVIKYAVNTPFNITEIKERAKLKYSESRKQIQAFCRMNMRTDPHLSSLNSDEVYWNKRVWTVPQHHLSYCDISLNAASTMTHHLIDLGGKTRQEVMDRFKNDNPTGMGLRIFLKDTIFGKPDDISLKTYTDKNLLSVVFVRHPFKKLVSGYYQKIRQDWETDINKNLNFYRELRGLKNMIIMKQRGLSFNDPELEMAIPTPVEYVDYIISEVRTQSMNHVAGLFKLQSEGCPFCLLDYDVIGRMETFKEDVEYVMEELRIKDRLEYDIHVNRYFNEDSYPREEREKDFFSQLTKANIRKLFYIYKKDFQMFGYKDYTNYIALGTGQ